MFRFSLLFLVLFLLIGCNSGSGIQPEEKQHPVEVIINSSFENCYKVTADILTEYNFTIDNSDNILGIIQTGFNKYKAGSKGFLYGALTGMEDFRMQINAKISKIDNSSCQLSLLGKMKYKESDNIFKSSEHVETIKEGSDSYKQLEKIALEIKKRSED